MAGIDDVRPLAGGLSLVAIACMALAIRDTVTGSEDARRGWMLRVAALACFAAAVALNALAS